MVLKQTPRVKRGGRGQGPADSSTSATASSASPNNKSSSSSPSSFFPSSSNRITIIVSLFCLMLGVTLITVGQGASSSLFFTAERDLITMTSRPSGSSSRGCNDARQGKREGQQSLPEVDADVSGGGRGSESGMLSDQSKKKATSRNNSRVKESRDTQDVKREEGKEGGDRGGEALSTSSDSSQSSPWVDTTVLDDDRNSVLLSERARLARYERTWRTDFPQLQRRAYLSFLSSYHHNHNRDGDDRQHNSATATFTTTLSSFHPSLVAWASVRYRIATLHSDADAHNDDNSNNGASASSSSPSSSSPFSFPPLSPQAKAHLRYPMGPPSLYQHYSSVAEANTLFKPYARWETPQDDREVWGRWKPSAAASPTSGGGGDGDDKKAAAANQKNGHLKESEVTPPIIDYAHVGCPSPPLQRRAPSSSSLPSSSSSTSPNHLIISSSTFATLLGRTRISAVVEMEEEEEEEESSPIPLKEGERGGGTSLSSSSSSSSSSPLFCVMPFKGYVEVADDATAATATAEGRGGGGGGGGASLASPSSVAAAAAATPDMSSGVLPFTSQIFLNLNGDAYNDDDKRKGLGVEGGGGGEGVGDDLLNISARARLLLKSATMLVPPKEDREHLVGGLHTSAKKGQCCVAASKREEDEGEGDEKEKQRGDRRGMGGGGDEAHGQKQKQKQKRAVAKRMWRTVVNKWLFVHAPSWYVAKIRVAPLFTVAKTHPPHHHHHHHQQYRITLLALRRRVKALHFSVTGGTDRRASYVEHTWGQRTPLLWFGDVWVPSIRPITAASEHPQYKKDKFGLLSFRMSRVWELIYRDYYCGGDGGVAAVARGDDDRDDGTPLVELAGAPPRRVSLSILSSFHKNDTSSSSPPPNFTPLHQVSFDASNDPLTYDEAVGSAFRPMLPSSCGPLRRRRMADRRGRGVVSEGGDNGANLQHDKRQHDGSGNRRRRVLISRLMRFGPRRIHMGLMNGNWGGLSALSSSSSSPSPSPFFVPNNNNNYDWFIRLWDDNYYLEENLFNIVGRIDHDSKKVMIGKIGWRNMGKDAVYPFAGGGAGWFLSKAAMAVIGPSFAPPTSPSSSLTKGVSVTGEVEEKEEDANAIPILVVNGSALYFRAGVNDRGANSDTVADLSASNNAAAVDPPQPYNPSGLNPSLSGEEWFIAFRDRRDIFMKHGLHNEDVFLTAWFHIMNVSMWNVPGVEHVSPGLWPKQRCVTDLAMYRLRWEGWAVGGGGGGGAGDCCVRGAGAEEEGERKGAEGRNDPTAFSSFSSYTSLYYDYPVSDAKFLLEKSDYSHAKPLVWHYISPSRLISMERLLYGAALLAQHVAEAEVMVVAVAGGTPPLLDNPPPAPLRLAIEENKKYSPIWGAPFPPFNQQPPASVPKTASDKAPSAAKLRKKSCYAGIPLHADGTRKLPPPPGVSIFEALIRDPLQ